MKAFPRRLKEAIRNLARLTLPSIFLFLIVSEAFVRLTLPVSDYPDVLFNPALGYQFVPNQTGRYVKGIPSEISAIYSINSSGWNSNRNYTLNKRPGVMRIAIIGDSYVEALQVDHSKSFPYLLENNLNIENEDVSFEIYSYGHSGANLVQYLNVLRHEVLHDDPDLIFVNVVSNDYKESFNGFNLPGQWSIKGSAGEYIEISPSPSRYFPIKRFIRYSALARYLFINLSLPSRITVLMDTATGKSDNYQSNITSTDLSDIGGDNSLKEMLHYVFSSMIDAVNADVGSENARLAIIFDADRQFIYNDYDPDSRLPMKMNRIAIEIARNLGIPTIDLQIIFSRSWEEEKKPFEWKGDGHWNDHSHEIVSDALHVWISDNMISKEIEDSS